MCKKKKSFNIKNNIYNYYIITTKLKLEKLISFIFFKIYFSLKRDKPNLYVLIQLLVINIILQFKLFLKCKKKNIYKNYIIIKFNNNII